MGGKFKPGQRNASRFIKKRAAHFASRGYKFQNPQRTQEHRRENRTDSDL